jgi:hypothetical protein
VNDGHGVVSIEPFDVGARLKGMTTKPNLHERTHPIRHRRITWTQATGIPTVQKLGTRLGQWQCKLVILLATDGPQPDCELRANGPVSWQPWATPKVFGNK